MKPVGPALSDHLHLAAAGAIEIGSVIVGPDLELLDALHGSRHDARGTAAGSSAHKTAGRCITRIGPILVAGIISSVELEQVLVYRYAGHLARRRDGRLQNKEGVGVPT